MRDQSRRLCIISGDLLRSGEFITALGNWLRVRPHEPVEIIMDRRHESALMQSSLEDRRRQSSVDRALATNGYAIVPESVHPNEDPTEAAVEARRLEDVEDMRRLERMLAFRRRRSRRLAGRLRDAFFNGLHTARDTVNRGRMLPTLGRLLAIVVCVTLATFALSPAGQNLGKSLIGRISGWSPLNPGSPAVAPPVVQFPPIGRASAPTNEASTVRRVPEVTDPVDESAPGGGPASTIQAPLDKETSIPPKPPTGHDGSNRPRVGGTARPSPSSPPDSASVASKSAPKTAAPKATPLPAVGSPRVELAREPRSVGWGDSYAVRLLNAAGRPMLVTEIVLIVRRADGTVENIAMGALPEPGNYRATVPTRRSSPTNLRVRVSYGGKRVEIPVRRG